MGDGACSVVVIVLGAVMRGCRSSNGRNEHADGGEGNEAVKHEGDPKCLQFKQIIFRSRINQLLQRGTVKIASGELSPQFELTFGDSRRLGRLFGGGVVSGGRDVYLPQAGECCVLGFLIFCKAGLQAIS